MKVVVADLPSELEQIQLHIFSDWHIGDPLCDMPCIREQIARVKDTPNAFVICNGDLINNAVKTSPSDVYHITMSPQEQMTELISLLEPIKDKILIVSTGNHESRTLRNDGIDITAAVCLKLGLDTKYCAEGGVLFVRFGNRHQGGRQGNGKCSYSLYVTHGSGGGRREGGKINRLADLAGIVDTDIYVHSHTHTPAIMKQAFYRLNYQSASTIAVEKLFVNSSSALTYGGYGQVASYKPNSKSNPTIFLEARTNGKKVMWAVL